MAATFQFDFAASTYFHAYIFRKISLYQCSNCNSYTLQFLFTTFILEKISVHPISVPNQTNVTTNLHTHVFSCSDEAVWLATRYIIYSMWHLLLSNQFSSYVNPSYSDRSLETISFMPIISVLSISVGNSFFPTQSLECGNFFVEKHDVN